MEQEGLDHIVYSKNVLEFVTVGNEYCNQLENSFDKTSKELLTIMVRILPLLYIKAVVLPKTDFVLEENIEKTVREEDYIRVQHTLLNILGQHDDFLEVFVQDNELDQRDVASSISENLTDIYQDLKDFLFAYRIGVTDIMNDALVEVTNSFEMYWGQKLVNVLRACHNVLYSAEDLDDDILGGSESGDPLKDNDWFSRFQDQWNDEEN
ncbi:DUF5063 domain-containing protein [Plebeiibacterium sediminum]|uniref:DUF5063 domain-containing protein n=1 Tax=Plebeiibacterium sediminum TaxID=2992112 RepID=A0AAE3SFQ0_9BACT|nr:DUF5063 domain-containing protein [Plebeiobacterium sediminum]MCW3786408.1 DUF5063 domain-containing protein [Plebeiobacterium sediminum]